MFNIRYHTFILVGIIFFAGMAMLLHGNVALADSPNLIANPSFEQLTSPTMPTAWAKGGYGTNTSTMTFPVAGYDGSNAARVDITAYASGDRKWYFNDVPVIAGHQYTFSDWSRSNVLTELDIRYLKTNGTYSYPWLKTINPNNAWQYNTATFTVPAGVSTITIFHTIQSVGWLEVDAYSLTDAAAPPPSFCGDGIKQSPNDAGQYEECDGASGVGPHQTCTNQCTLTNLSYCGDGTIDPGEQCDGNSTSCTAANGYQGTKTCNMSGANTCTWNNCIATEWCGDNIINGNEECDGTSGVGPNQTCTNQCTLSDITPSDNLIPNPSFEVIGANGQPESWKSNKYGTNSATFAYPVTGYDGNRAAMVTITNYSSGDAKWMSAEVPVQPSTRYRLSDQYLSTGTSAVTLQYRSTSNTISYQWLTDLSPAQQWTAYQTTFVTPANAQSVSIFHVLRSTGTLTTDAFNLEDDNNNTTFPQGMVSINLDDGYRQAYQNGLPILDAAGYKATLFVITETMNGGFSNYINSSEMLDAQSRGHNIAAHTRTHPHMLNLSPQQLTNEIAGSRQDLLNAGLTPVVNFAYPYGEYNSNVINAVQQAGFIGARVTTSGYNFKDTSPFILKSTAIQSSTTISQIQTMIDTAIQSHAWLILTFHDIRADGQGGTWAVTSNFFQQVVDYLTASQIKVITNAQGISYLNT